MKKKSTILFFVSALIFGLFFVIWPLIKQPSLDIPQKEPVTVVIPSSVYIEKDPDTDVVNVLVSPQGNVFVGATGSATLDEGEEILWGTDTLRRVVLNNAVADYARATGREVTVTKTMEDEFAKMDVFGLPIEKLPVFFSKSADERDDWMAAKNLGQGPLGDVKDSDVGIPTTNFRRKDNGEETNEFQIWMRAYYNSGSDKLQKAMKTGNGIFVKADHNLTYDSIKDVLDNLRAIHMNRFTLMTSLKDTEEVQ